MDGSGGNDETRYVSREASEGLISSLERAAADPCAGIFGPQSVSWRINRESALFLAAGRAALLQLAHPWVATALQQHSQVAARPIARFHSTFRIVFTMVFGSAQQAAAAARHLYSVHTRIEGEMPEDIGRWRRGAHYQANEEAALRWVYATLVESAVMAYECVLPRLSGEDLDACLAETRTLAALFGLRPSSLPAGWQSFLTYCREMEQSDALGVGPNAREMAQGLMAGTGSWIKPPHWYRALTAAWLPERLRVEFGLPFGVSEANAAAAARRRLRQIYSRLPQALRFLGPWHEARARIAGRAPGLLARTSNRFWIGQVEMPFAPGDNSCGIHKKHER